MTAPKRRILHFIDSGGVYGAEQVILNLSREMAESSQFEPIIGCIVSDPDEPSALHEKALSSGFEAIKIQIRNHLLFRDLPAASRTLRKERISLIHSHGYKPSVFSFFIRVITKIPAMATCHLWFKPEEAPLKTRVMISLERRLYRRFPVVVAVSDPIRRILEDAGIPPSTISLIPNGIDFKPYSPEHTSRNSTREELGIDSDTFCVINTARLVPQKDQSTLIDATKILRAKGIPVTTLIVGQGPAESALREKVKQLSLDKCVWFLGYRSDTGNLLAAADAFAMPSLDEGMPISLLEAVAARTPVVVTPVGDIPKLIHAGGSGFVVRPKDPIALAEALEKIYLTPNHAMQLADNAYIGLTEQFSSESMATQYFKLYSRFSRQVPHDSLSQ